MKKLPGLNMDQKQIDRLLEMYSQGLVSKRTVMEAVGLGKMWESEMEHDPEIISEEYEIDPDDFLERTYPVGSLIIPHQKMSQYSVNVGLNKRPGGKPAVGYKLSDKSVNVHPRMTWTVIEHRSGWTKIASSDGQHAGWSFHIRDRFQLFDTYAANCELSRERR